VYRRLLVSLALVTPLVLPRFADAADPAGTPRTVESLLREVQSSGIDVVFSSYLVPPELLAPPGAPPSDPLAAAREALASHGLELRRIGARRYVVAAAPAPDAAPAPVDEPLQEISVYASRYAIDSRAVGEARSLGSAEIEAIPGAHDDSLRALKTLPGLATNVSARPYIRGSLSEDVLVRYDGITLLDPYHLKNFQSLFSAIDPAAVDGIEVFSGGFPVNYGTRSGGVINLSAPVATSGSEHRASASLISAGVSTIGVADEWPLEWFGAIRRSTLDLIEPVQDGFGTPQFGDSLGRLRWKTAQGVWTVGWLLLDDRLSFGETGDTEIATARYRDEYVWLARDHRFGDSLRMRVAMVTSSSDRDRSGTLSIPGVASGALDEREEFDRIEITNDWTYDANDGSTYVFGGQLSYAEAGYQHARDVAYSPATAAAFGRPASDSIRFAAEPRAFNYAAYAANRRRWRQLDAEFGVRFDAQDYRGLGQHTQLSPRLNLRYDVSDATRLYASVGRFTQAQHIEEWRAEEGQPRSDAALSSIHSILGMTREMAGGARWSIEAYCKRWTRVSPYYDNQLDPLSLLPELAPDRVRVAPRSSESTGLELNVRAPFGDRFQAWGSVSWSHVADDFSGGDVLRSWDQSSAVSSGVAWEGARWSFSALGGWHRGWPRTPFVLTAPSANEPGTLILGERSSDRWGDYFTLDLRAAWRRPLFSGELTTTLEIANSTNRSNPCCTSLEGAFPGERLRVETDHWLPVIANLGFVYRWRSD
jgi:outer membrane receptor protein involved in Fe transport